MLDLYKNIRERRQYLKMSQDELARKTGYSNRSSIATVEAGKVDLPLSKIKEIATALDCSVSYLMGWDEEPKPNNPDFVVSGIENDMAELLIEANYNKNQSKHLAVYSMHLVEEEKLLLEKYRESPQNIKDAIKTLLDV